MDALLEDLLELLKLERLEDNLFRGHSRDIGSKQVFGGQVLGQALIAATRTVENRKVHSLHAYFLRPGDMSAPIVYDVDRSRDGRNFTVRRVVAIQHGRPIFNFSASFHTLEEGVDHQEPMPGVPGPDGLRDSMSYSMEHIEVIPEKLRRFFMHCRPFEFRPVEPPEIQQPSKRPARQHIWFRATDRLPDDDGLHRCLLSYVSDYNLVMTAILPHGLSLIRGNLKIASLDHAMWFHRPPKVDQWLLYACDSPSASGARGLARGMIFQQDGTLVASTVQEGLIRVSR